MNDNRKGSFWDLSKRPLNTEESYFIAIVSNCGIYIPLVVHENSQQLWQQATISGN